MRCSALKMSFENELGVIRPTGFWDPLGLTKNMDQEVSHSDVPDTSLDAFHMVEMSPR